MHKAPKAQGITILLLATETWQSHGGIQRYMQMLTRILANRDGGLTVVTLLDSGQDRKDTKKNVVAVCCHASKLRFCVEVFRQAFKRDARVAISGHTSLLPLGWALKVTRLAKHHVLVLHGIEAWRRLSWFSRYAMASVDVIVATTNYTVREFTTKNHPGRSPFVVIPLACEFKAEAVYPPRPPEVLTLVTVTRLSASDRYKGVDTILRAVSIARKAGLRLALNVVGNGNDEQRLRDVAHSLEIDDLVTFRGSVSDSELQRLLAESDIFVLPSKKEGFGLVYIEAMAAGLPCIGANHGGVPEVIEHGESGFLIEYGDAVQLVFYLRALAESPALYQLMSLAARKRASETFAFENMTRSWRHLIENLTGRGFWSDSDEPQSRQSQRRIAICSLQVNKSLCAESQV